MVYPRRYVLQSVATISLDVGVYMILDVLKQINLPIGSEDCPTSQTAK